MKARRIECVQFMVVRNGSRVCVDLIPAGQCHSKWSTMQHPLWKPAASDPTCRRGVAFVHCTRSVGDRPCKLSGCRSTERALGVAARRSPCWTKPNAATPAPSCLRLHERRRRPSTRCSLTRRRRAPARDGRRSARRPPARPRAARHPRARLARDLCRSRCASSRPMRSGCTRRRSSARSRNCWSQLGIGEYLAQIQGGIPMSQGEIVRPADVGLAARGGRRALGGPAAKLSLPATSSAAPA